MTTNSTNGLTRNLPSVYRGESIPDFHTTFCPSFCLVCCCIVFCFPQGSVIELVLVKSQVLEICHK